MKTFLFVLAILISLTASICEAQYAAQMQDYCSNPPYIQAPVKANVMVILDVTGSMQVPAYLPCVTNDYTYTYIQTRCQTPTSQTYRYMAYKADGVTPNNYYGYFDSTKYYQVSSSAFQVNTSCVDDPNRVGTSGSCISGNVLNWATMTRMDVMRKVMTGGRTQMNPSAVSDQLESEGATVTYTDQTMHCRFSITTPMTTSDDRKAYPSTRSITITNQTGYTCPITLGTSRVVVKTDTASITGIVHEFWDALDMEFMVFSSQQASPSPSWANRPGIMRTGKPNVSTTALSDAARQALVDAINTETPHGSTNTGYALDQASIFFQQGTSSYNSSFISRGNATYDPFYDKVGTSNVARDCRSAFVLLLSDGAWNSGTDPIRRARTMRTTDLRTDTGLPGTQNVTTYAVYALGENEPQGLRSLKTTAMFGGFTFRPGDTYPYPYTSYPSDSKDVVWPISQCTPCDPWPADGTCSTWNTNCFEWDTGKKGEPYNFFMGNDGNELEVNLRLAFTGMMARVASGTASSILASSEGSGATLVQAVFYPTRLFGDKGVQWPGVMQNFWYYLEPFMTDAGIREDNADSGVSGTKTLDISQDNCIIFKFDSGQNKTFIERYAPQSATGKCILSGAETTYIDTLAFEKALGVWEAGAKLHATEAANRTIYYNATAYNSDPASDFTYPLLNFTSSIASDTTTRSYLQASSQTEGEAIINFIRGTDQSLAGYTRSRKADTALLSDKEWKLGDIVSSTPRVQSSIPNNNYHMYPPRGYSDTTYRQRINSDTYKNYGMVYVGANDGMLHAFKLGVFKLRWDNKSAAEKAQLSGTDIGQEAWAFVPRNALPYLKYLGRPDYIHLYFVDLPSTLVDASTGGKNGSATTTKTGDTSSWRTYLIGGMGFGGAVKNNNATGCTTTTCVRTPVQDIGFSSYFALDVTDPTAPSLVWEFSHPDLGFATSGPAILRVGANKDTNGNYLNGEWFVVIGSGPTGPVVSYENKAQSDQRLKYFVLNLKDGKLRRVIDTLADGTTTIEHAFSGTIFNAAVDADRDKPYVSGFYQDDVIYMGYTRKDTTAGTWTKGGVLRLQTFENTNPAAWKMSHVVQNIGPVTTGIAKLQNFSTKRNSFWIYFGTGRYFYKLDDPGGTQKIYGVKEPCYSTVTKNIPSNFDCSSLPAVDVTNTSKFKNMTSIDADAAYDTYTVDGQVKYSNTDPNYWGWYVDLAAQGTLGAERIITDPLAAENGAVYFTSFQPNEDTCGFGGDTALWILQYNSGGNVVKSGSMGKALLQVSTGSIEQLDLKRQNFTSSSGYRRSTTFKGAPPRGQGLNILVGNPPIQKILQIRER